MILREQVSWRRAEPDNPRRRSDLTDVWELGELVGLMPKPIAKPWGSVKRAAVGK
jgi:hypothetical protein